MKKGLKNNTKVENNLYNFSEEKKRKKLQSNINSIISDIKKGKPIIVIDSKERENEGDLVLSAEKANVDNIAFCMRYARGLMCIPTTNKTLNRLKIPMMVEKTNDPFETPFTVSVDGVNTHTGMSVHDRLKTISIIVNDKSKPKELQKPGHLFPLRARKKLLQERKGHTESSIELMKLSNLKEIAIIVEIINDDGTMAKGKSLLSFAKKHNLQIISIDEIYNYLYS